ncbi:MAG: type I-D CRISPR-associated helicase Cas3' [Candidatus Thorarchaeota archaeon]
MSDTYLSYEIPNVKLASSSLIQGNMTYYKYQAQALDIIAKHRSAIIEIHAGTGMGKTAIAVAACLNSPTQSAMMLYPTNELIENQQSSILKTCQKLKVEEPIIKKVHSSEIRRFMHEEDYRKKSRALSDLLYPAPDGKAKFVLTNPDTFHLILQLRYGGEARYGMRAAEVLHNLSYYSILCVDEFHTYEMRELSSLYFDLGFARFLNAFPTILLMTATPHNQLSEYLDHLGYISNMDHPDPIIPELSDSGNEVIHQVNLSIAKRTDHDLEQMVHYLSSIAEKLRRLRKENPSNDFIPACVILNSVIDARSLAEHLLNFFDKEEVKESHGLIPQRARRERQNALILVGTSAIEVGIDFDTAHLIFEAWNASSAIQRLGRVGRHRPGHALMFTQDYVYNYFSQYVERINSRAHLVTELKKAIGENDSGIWYLNSKYSRFELRLTRNRIKKALESTDAAKSYHSVESLEEFFEKYLQELPHSALNTNIEALLKKAQKSFVSLRSSQPIALVHDHVAERRGFFPVYFSPVSRILRRARKYKIQTGTPDENIRTIYGARKKQDSETSSSIISDSIQDYWDHIRANRKVCVIDLFGYMQNGYRRVAMQLADTLPNTIRFQPIVGINESDFLGTTLGFSNLEYADILDSLYENELYAIVDGDTRRKLGWRLENYPIVGGSSKAYAYFNANALVALAYYDHHIKNGLE